MKDYLNVVVTGEIDSGKSTLIGRFLYETGSLSKGAIEEIKRVCQRLDSDFEFAYLLDSFEEERRNQLTIDTTQVFCKTKKGKEFIFIDVPGHQELIKNMLCGSSYADIAILVVDIQKSIESQTKRHAFILKLLGIEQILVVFNKMDLVDFNENIFKREKRDVTEFFKKIGLQPGYFIPISAKQGENFFKKSKKMAWHKGPSLFEGLNTYVKKKRNGWFRLPVQDVYTVNKEKIVVGKIIWGNIKRGDKLKILPLNREYTVKSIKIFEKNKSMAKSPESIGLILDEMDNISRGGVICKPKLPQVNTEISSRFFCVHPLNIKDILKFRCATQESSAQIRQIKGVWDSGTLEPKAKEEILKENDIVEAIIVTENPVVIESFKGFNALGRFVLKNKGEIYAVGIIP